MMERITLTIPRQPDGISYDISIGSGLLRSLPELCRFEDYSRVLIVLDRALEASCGDTLRTMLGDRVSLYPIDCGEKSKDLAHLEKLLTCFHAHKLDRRSLVINIGGGALGDFGGFAASIYMRGLSFIQVPSTLLSQVDASVGGKVAINFLGVKNLLGAFQQPAAVIIDVALLETLPRREYLSGFAEIIKHAIIRDREFFTLLQGILLQGIRLETADHAELIRVIRRSCEIKGDVVQKDPHETGLRRILNFGHTVAHAIESLAAESPAPLLHGECVALGMVAESAVAVARGMMTSDDRSAIEKLLGHFHLPIHLTRHLPTDMLLQRMRSDKKNTGGSILLALPDRIGNCQPQVAVTESELITAVETLYR